MTLQKVNLAYFSATGTTAKIVSAIESGFNAKEKNIIKLASPRQETLMIPNDEIIIFGIPVFSGRVPEIARKGIERIKGNNTPAIIACVYGNRDFDDALIELKDIVESNGFHVLSAGAFVAQHSIFPDVAEGRPDRSDLAQAKEFGATSYQIISMPTDNRPFEIKGNRPYRAVKPIPLTPKTNNKCNACGLCYKECPVQAINADNPKKRILSGLSEYESEINPLIEPNHSLFKKQRPQRKSLLKKQPIVFKYKNFNTLCDLFAL